MALQEVVYCENQGSVRPLPIDPGLGVVVTALQADDTHASPCTTVMP